MLKRVPVAGFYITKLKSVFYWYNNWFYCLMFTTQRDEPLYGIYYMGEFNECEHGLLVNKLRIYKKCSCFVIYYIIILLYKLIMHYKI
jgi:hypothetical protein